MEERVRLPDREQVFVLSLKYHGFRATKRRKDLKYKHGYVISATKREDASGIDFWIKMPRDDQLFPIQVTQRGIRLFRKYDRPTPEKLREFVARSEERIKRKRRQCKKHGIAFVLVRDFDGSRRCTRIAWGDIKALRHAIAHLARWHDEVSRKSCGS